LTPEMPNIALQEEKMEEKHPEYPVQMTYVNHGKVFGKENWYTFYCGECGHQVFKFAVKCEKCGAILQSPQN